MKDNTTREAILERASGLFASRGYSAVSMRDVAGEVGVAAANLYYYFPDKEELIRQSLDYVFSNRIISLDDIINEHASPDQRFEKVVSWFVGIIFSEDIFGRLLLREFLDGDDRRLEYLSKTVFKKPFTLLTNVIEEYSNASNPAMMAISVVGLILGHFQLSRSLPYLPGGKLEYSEPATVTRHVLALLRPSFRTANQVLRRSE